ncbi:MAG: metal ABC transporter substrate-binding protein [Phycisphaerales bacterium]
MSVPPLAWVARGLAPAEASVTVLVPPGVSPHGWEPTPAQAQALHGSDLVLLVGAGMEPAIDRSLAARGGSALRVLRFGEAVGVTGNAHDHEHDATADHAHDHEHAVDPHLWLDPALMADLVRAAHDRMLESQDLRGALDDDERARLGAARDALLAEVALVREDGAAALGAHAGAGLVTVHDAWDRFAQAFGLRVAGVLQHQGESEASPGAVAAAATMVRSGDARVIVVEPQYTDALARRVASETGAAVALLDPLGTGLPGGDWPAMMRANIAALASALAPAGEAGE